ncbi:MAG: cytoplasmic filament protein CfpA, partial [Treponemataceae bacterium]|nr:cytoplasmic filament protein CfpA [Treponemataceae bacterium]
YEDIAKVWDEVSFIKPGETEVERMNRTYLYEKDKIRHKLILMREKMKNMYGYQYPIQRRVMEERLNFLEKEFNRFDYMINPYHIQPGLLLDVDITSIKRKKATLDGMANVLNEFLHGVSKGFQDAAFASFSRRRSTVRQDIAQSFAESSSVKDAVDPGKAYLDMINAEESSSVVSALADTASAKATGRGRTAAKKETPAVVENTGKRGRPRRNAEKGDIREV